MQKYKFLIDLFNCPFSAILSDTVSNHIIKNHEMLEILEISMKTYCYVITSLTNFKFAWMVMVMFHSYFFCQYPCMSKFWKQSDPSEALITTK
jgi:hypothetical protein